MAETLDSGLNLTQDTSFNVRLNLLEGAPAPVSNQAGVDAMDRRIAEYEAAINADAGLPSEVRDALRDQLSRARSELSTNGVTPALVQLLESARNAYTQYSSGAAQSAQSSREADEALSNVRLTPANAFRVRQQLDAIQEGDIVVTARVFRGPAYDTLPQPLQVEAETAAVEQLGSPYGRAIMSSLRVAQRENPEVVERTLNDIAVRRQELERLIAGAQDSQTRGVLNSFLTSNAFAMPSANNFIAVAQRGGSVAELNAASAPAYAQLQQSVFGLIPTLRQTNVKQIDELVAGASPEMQQRLRSDDNALGRYIIERHRAHTDDMRTDALREYQRVGGDYARLSPQAREVLAVQSLMASTSSAITISGALMQLGRTQELARAQAQDGRVLTADEQVHVDSLNFIRDPSNRLIERAERLVDSTMGALNMAHPRMRQQIENTRENSLALATLTLAFADRNGGIARFQEMAIRMQQPSAQGPIDPEAQAFFANYQNFLSQTLIGENFNPTDLSQGARLAVALRTAGLELQNGSMEVINGADGVRLYRPNSLNFDGTTSAFANTDALLLQATGGASGVVGRMYVESRTGERSQDPEFVRLVRQIDTYRLHTDPSSQQLILDLQLQRRPLSEISEELNGRIEVARNGMAAFVPSVLGRADEFTRAAMTRANILGANGEVDLVRLMEQVESNKSQFFDVYRQYLNVPLDQLPPGMADARVLREFTSQLQAAQSVENLLERRDVVTSELTAHETNGTTPPAALVAESQRLAIIAGYNPSTATPEQHAAFNRALYDTLMQDPYIREKETADRDKPAEQRSQIVANTTDVIRSTLIDNPRYFSERTVGYYSTTAAHEASQAETPVAQLPGEQAPTRIVSRYDDRAPLDARESEGSSNPLDGLTKSDLEKAVLGVVQQMTTEVRYETFAASIDAVSQRVSTEKNKTINLNKGDQSFISYNEIEAALIANGWRRPEDIDTDRNGVDDQDILRALATPNVANGGQGTGRS